MIDDATAVRSRYLLDYLFTMVDDATVCIPLYVHLPRYLFAVIHTPVCWESGMTLQRHRSGAYGGHR